MYLLTRIGLMSMIILVTFCTGCNPCKSYLKKFDQDYVNCNYTKATLYAESKISKSDKPKGDDLLWSLQTASLSFMVDNHNTSIEHFDKCEEMLNYFDYQNQATATLLSTVINDNANPYVGEEYDGIMVNTYKAINFIILGRHELARVEFNRALDRQSRAKEHFASEIAKLRQQTQEGRKKYSNLQQSIDSAKVQTQLSSKYPALSEYEVYPDFVNPFTIYLAGVYFNLVDDNLKSADLLKEAYGMVPDNSFVKNDMASIEAELDRKEKLTNTAWVIFENGLCPIKEEFRIDLPLFIVTQKVYYTGIALPRLQPRQQAYRYLVVNGDSNEYRTEVVADMERIIQTEFKKDFTGVLTRAIISASVKAAAQYAMTEQNNNAANIAAIIIAAYNLATNTADVRIWTTLPKDFQVARVAIPQDRVIEIKGDDGTKIVDIAVSDCNNAVIYLKIPIKQSISYDVIKF